MTPSCWNRPPRRSTYTANVGLSDDGRQLRAEIASAFSDRCATWDGRGIGPRGEPYPVAHGWANACRTCTWLPDGVL